MFTTYNGQDLDFRFFNQSRKWRWPKLGKLSESKNNYNLCPTQSTAIIAIDQGKIGFHFMRWGLVPAWAATVKDADKYSMINAKCEEIDEKRSYKSAFQKRRCLVPITGFYEWQRQKEVKRPFAITLQSDEIMAVAGIWERWTSKTDGEVVESFSLITTSANSFMKKIHDRMPVILAEEQWQDWLDPEKFALDQLQSLMKPCPSKWLKAHEVSTLVNSPRNNHPDVLKAIVNDK